MAENVYECMLIFDSTRYGRNPAGVSGQIAEIVQKLDGKMLVSRLWEERKLAFPIARQKKGTYWLSYFRIDSGKIQQIRQDCKLSDSILRALILKIDARIADALVSHAQGTATPEKPTPKPDAPKGSDGPESSEAPANSDAPESPESADSGAEKPAETAAE